MKKLNSFILSFLFILSFSACNRCGHDNKQTSEISYDTTLDIHHVKKALENMYYLFPTPSEVLFTMKEEGLVYEPKLLNSLEKREMYVMSNDQYLNLGVYIADLSYCALFSRNNTAEEYLETVRRMSENLHLSTKAYSTLIDKVKENISSVDTIAKITNDFFYSVINDLEVNNRQSDVAIITTGAYIECLYLSSNQVKIYTKDNLIVQKIAEQKQAFNLLYQYSKKYFSEEDLIKSFSFIKQINDAFGRLSIDDKDISVKNDSSNHLMVTGRGTVVSSEAEFMSFKESITKIRNSITK